jgi:flavin-dependent dehydrogenase
LPNDFTYDLAIAGGGLAGLALAIQSARKGHRVILFEKEKYPFHRVCGEYISMESWNFLQELGIDLPSLHVSTIQTLQISGVDGKILQQKLPLGGFGISRFTLDHTLSKIAVAAGVKLMEETKISDIHFDGAHFIISTSAGNFISNVAAATFGKRSNLDVKWKRPFTTAEKNKLNNYIGVKYHIRCGFPADTIALHIFDHGYCGLVKIEDDLYNLCYLTTAANLQKAGDIQNMEKIILSRNPHLHKIWHEAEWISREPVVISQISFDKKSLVEEHILMVGDAAGMITPLCGNGMSMALHASKTAAIQIDAFLSGNITRQAMENNYHHAWQKNFHKRLRTGRRIQRWFGNARLTNMLISTGKLFPALIKYLVRCTHGKPF